MLSLILLTLCLPGYDILDSQCQKCLYPENLRLKEHSENFIKISSMVKFLLSFRFTKNNKEKALFFAEIFQNIHRKF